MSKVILHQSASTTASAANAPTSLADLFWAFSSLGLAGFGGVTPWARRMLVERKQWLNERDFAELLSLGQLLPGSNVSNMAIILGRSYFGWRGALLAVCGLHMFPLAIIVGLGLAYRQYGQLLWVQHVLAGMLPVTAGMVIATAIKLMQGVPRTLHSAGFILLTFVAITIGHFSLPLVLLLVAPLAVACTWRLQ